MQSEIQLTENQIKLYRGKLEKHEIPGQVAIFVAIFDQLSCCCLSWMSAITRNHKNGCHESTIKVAVLTLPNETIYRAKS